MDKLTVKLLHDSDLECPNNWDAQWRLYTFHPRHRGSIRPANLDLGVKRDGTPSMPMALRNKFKVGLAFFLDYFEHSGSLWSLHGEGMQCRWDTSQYCGLLVWEHKPGDMGAKTIEDRAKDAKAFLETHNAWANGQGYGYQIETEEGEEVDSCFGFYTSDHMLDEIAHELKGKDYKVEGEAEYLARDLYWKVKELDKGAQV